MDDVKLDEREKDIVDRGEQQPAVEGHHERLLLQLVKPKPVLKIPVLGRVQGAGTRCGLRGGSW